MSDRDPFEQLTGAFDRPVAPAPDFAARLRAHALGELDGAADEEGHAANRQSLSHRAEGKAKNAHTPLPLSPNGRLHHIPAAPIQGSAPTRPIRRLRWLPALEIAAAVLLMVTLLGQVVGPERLRNAVVPDAFQPARSDMSGDAAMWGANPGRTWVMAVEAPDLAGLQPIELEADPETMTMTMLVHGPRIFHAGIRLSTGEPFLAAVNAVDGTELWSARGRAVEVHGRMAAVGDTLLVVNGRPDPTNNNIVGQLTAYDVETADVRWFGPELGPVNDNPAVGPIIIDDIAYVAAMDGVPMAVDLETGEVIWRGFAPDPIDGTDPGPPSMPGGMIAADDDAIYTALADGTLQAYDREAGDILWTAELAEPGAGALYVALAVQDNRVITTIRSGVMDRGGVRLPDVIAAFDAESGDRVWSKETSLIIGDTVIQDDTVVVVVQDGPDPPTLDRLLALDVANGTTRWELREGLATSLNWLSAAGNHIYVMGDFGQFSVVEDGQVVHSLTLASPSDPREQRYYPGPALLANDRLYIATGDGRILTLGASNQTPIRLPATANATPAPRSTPGPSPVATIEEGTPDRSALAGGTWTFDADLPAAAPGTPHTITPELNGGAAYIADISGDTLVRMVGAGQGSLGRMGFEAISLATGERRWLAPVYSPSPPVIADGRVFVHEILPPGGTYEETIAALDLASGEELWRVPFAGQRADIANVPVVVGSTLYVGDARGVVQALDIADGRTRWSAPSDVEPLPASDGLEAIQWLGIVVADERHVYTLTADGVFRALDLETGLDVWSEQIGGKYAERIIGLTAMTDGETVVLDVVPSTGADGPPGATITVALDAADGRPMWQRTGDADTAESAGAELIIDGIVLTYGLDGTLDGLRPLTALRASDGKELWRSDVIPYQTTLWSAAGDHAVAVVRGGSMIAIDLATGAEAWRVGIPPIEAASPLMVTDDSLVLIGGEGSTYVWPLQPATTDSAG